MRMGRWVAVWVACFGCTDKTSSDTIVPLPTTDSGTTPTPTNETGVPPTDTDTDTTVPAPAGLCADLTVPGDAIAVAAGSDLQAAVDAAPDGATLALAAGTYLVSNTVVLDKPITLISADVDSANVRIDGDYKAIDLFRIESSDVTIAHLTLQHSADALVQITPTKADVTGVHIHGNELVDMRGVAVTNYEGGEDWDGPFADDVEVSCNTIALTDEGRDEVEGTCDVAGIELYGTRGWVVRDNWIRDLWCEFALSDPGIRASRGTRDAVITRNQLVDVTFGIVLGETADAFARLYDDEPCGTDPIQAIDGWVTNNIVAAYDEDLIAADRFLTGIRLETSCNAMVLHNSVYSGIEPDSASLEQKYPTTTGIIANNMLSHEAVRYVEANADVYENLEFVAEDYWYFPTQGDFRTSPGATDAIDKGDPITVDLLDIDIDGEPREDGLPDIGADEK